MIRAPLCIALHLNAPRDREKPPGIALAAARGRQPHPADLDTLAPPFGALLLYPPGLDGNEDADRAARLAVRAALALRGTAVIFTRPHLAGAAETWLRDTAEGCDHG